jgi:hypothetical protein
MEKNEQQYTGVLKYVSRISINLSDIHFRNSHSVETKKNDAEIIELGNLRNLDNAYFEATAEYNKYTQNIRNIQLLVPL